jgi:hypothetical protein
MHFIFLDVTSSDLASKAQHCSLIQTLYIHHKAFESTCVKGLRDYRNPKIYIIRFNCLILENEPGQIKKKNHY